MDHNLNYDKEWFDGRSGIVRGRSFVNEKRLRGSNDFWSSLYPKQRISAAAISLGVGLWLLAASVVGPRCQLLNPFYVRHSWRFPSFKVSRRKFYHIFVRKNSIEFRFVEVANICHITVAVWDTEIIKICVRDKTWQIYPAIDVLKFRIAMKIISSQM